MGLPDLSLLTTKQLIKELDSRDISYAFIWKTASVRELFFEANGGSNEIIGMIERAKQWAVKWANKR